MASESVIARSPMFEAELKYIPPDFSYLLEQYAKVPKESQIAHVLSLRNRAYNLRPYPCLGRFRFMDLDLSNHPRYSQILSRLKSPDDDELLLDFGCCIGQDIRKLLLDGAPVAKIYGSDIMPEFIDTGLDLFNDAASFPKDHFVAPADAFDVSANNALARFDRKVSVLHISAVFHLFGIENQQKLAKRCLELLSHGKKCLVLGGQTANLTAGEFESNGKKRWRHNGESWAHLWEDAAKCYDGCIVKSHSVLGGKNIKAIEGAAQVETERSKVIGLREEGFRWMVWWTEVEFHTKEDDNV